MQSIGHTPATVQSSVPASMEPNAPNAERKLPVIIPNPVDEDESTDPEPAVPEVYYYVLQTGRIAGPFTIKRVVEMALTHTVNRSDFVQIAGSSQWLPLPVALDPSVPPPEGTNPAPQWTSILAWCWLRLRYNLDEKSLLAGWICLGIAVLGVLLSQWQLAFWGPLTLPPLVAAIALIRQRRFFAGGLLLAADAMIPWIATAQ